MDDATFRELIRRRPFGTCGDDEWHAITARLLVSLSRFLGVKLEFVGDRRPGGNNFSPLVRSVGDILPAVGIRLAGMISCSTPNRASELRIDALLFVFVGGERVGPPGREFFTCDYLGPGDDPEWVRQGWQTTDFADEWDPYTFARYFGGAEAELPGCGPDAEPSSASPSRES